MRSYKEYSAAFEKAIEAAEIEGEPDERLKPFYIAALFLQDHKISYQDPDEKQKAAAALEQYPQEEQEAFADTLNTYFETMNAITSRFRRGRQ